ncbi:hypothetical protein [Butyrivibrio sp. AE3003]|uniref:Orn/Lys/Arg family decarboxylase n=1 Tax=Butyrivibrio sp. AE3003 TaxID=1496721 RepID=UPI000691ECCB|nr:hypothetical protein [Butyrivibrio sp. AE3003]
MDSEKKYDKDGEYDSVPKNTINLGADIVIHSVHKTLPSMTQTSLVHISENEELSDKVKKYLRIYQTSSPSYVLMASIDLCMQEMEENGDCYIEALLDYRNRISYKTRSLKNIVIPGREMIDDPAKVVICDSSGTMTGKQIYGILREEYNLQLEMAGDKIALAILSGWDTTEGIDRLIEAVSELDEKIQKTKINTGTSVNDPICKKGFTEYPNVIMKLSEAWDRPTEETLLKEAKGKVAGDFINLYPPGIPLIVPGEEFSEELIQDICGYIEEDLNVQGVISEPSGTGFYVRTIK